MLLATNTKIFVGNNFRESVPTRKKHENFYPVKLTGYMVNQSASLFGASLYEVFNPIAIASEVIGNLSLYTLNSLKVDFWLTFVVLFSPSDDFPACGS